MCMLVVLLGVRWLCWLYVSIRAHSDGKKKVTLSKLKERWTVFDVFLYDSACLSTQKTHSNAIQPNTSDANSQRLWQKFILHWKLACAYIKTCNPKPINDKLCTAQVSARFSPSFSSSLHNIKHSSNQMAKQKTIPNRCNAPEPWQ